MNPASALFDLKRRELRAVVIGASAGGIEALRFLLSALPPTFGVPIIIVLHIGKEAQWSWSVVFADCKLPIREAEDKEPLSAGTVYLAPPDYHLLVDAEADLVLSIDEPVHMSRPSIDVLFESAAWAFGAGALAILLTGANADGAAGLATISSRGGSCWVQSPETALMATMPRAGLAAVPTARVLTLQQMAEAFAAWQP